MKKIDLNCDMGELKADQKQNFDSEIMPFISSCNIACGFHSGSPIIIENTIKSAMKHKVKIGSHPSYNDRENFGRVSRNIDRQVLLSELRYQICAVKGMVESFGARLHHVKPHGALYNDMVENIQLADDFVQLVRAIDPKLIIMTLAHSQVVDCCQKYGIQAIHEGFADRRYQTLTQLRNRRFEDAIIHEPEEILTQIQGFLDGKIRLVNGEVVSINVESICLHSDTKGAVVLSQHIHNYLKKQNVRISAMER